MTGKTLPHPRCGALMPLGRAANRLRQSAVRYHRFSVCWKCPVPGEEVSALDEKRMDAGVVRRLAQAAADADTHVVLIRRPGRHPSGEVRQQARPGALGVRRHVRPEAETGPLGCLGAIPPDLLSLGSRRRHPLVRPNAAGNRSGLALVCTKWAKARPVLRPSAGPPGGGGGSPAATDWGHMGSARTWAGPIVFRGDPSCSCPAGDHVRLA